MVKTSNYRISGKEPNTISIAGRAPNWYKGRQFKTLAPKVWFFKKYKKDKDEKFYTAQYYKEVLDVLNPERIYAELGQNVILLCWEEPGLFCHRHLVAEWLRDNLKINVSEIETPNPLGLQCPVPSCQSHRITSYTSLFDNGKIGCQCNKCSNTWSQDAPNKGILNA